MWSSFSSWCKAAGLRSVCSLHQQKQQHADFHINGPRPGVFTPPDYRLEWTGLFTTNLRHLHVCLNLPYYSQNHNMELAVHTGNDVCGSGFVYKRGIGLFRYLTKYKFSIVSECFIVLDLYTLNVWFSTQIDVFICYKI